MPREVRLGLFIALTLALLMVAVFYIGNKETRFKSTFEVKSDFKNVGGLEVGADVRVGGIHKGTVERIDLPKQPDGQVTVVMQLEKGTNNLIRQDSMSSIQSAGLLGDKYVEVTFGSMDSSEVHNGDTIGSTPPIDVSDLYARADKLLDSVSVTASNLESVTDKINNGTGSIGALINSKTVYNQAAKAATNMAEDTEALKHNFLIRGFFKNRGYEDSADLTKNGIAKLPETAAMKTFDLDESKLFDKSDNAKLKDRKLLQKPGDFMEANPYGLVVIASYSGNKGDAETEKKLTEARAVAIRDLLVKDYRLDDSRIRTKGFGMTEEAEGGVEILIYPPSVKAPANPNSPRLAKAPPNAKSAASSSPGASLPGPNSK